MELRAELQSLIETLQGSQVSEEDSVREAIHKLDHLLNNYDVDGISSSDIGSVKQQLDALVLPLFQSFEHRVDLVSQLMFIVGRAYREMGEFDAAREWYRQVLEGVGPQLPPQMRAEALKQLGHLASDQCDWDEAQVYYTRSMVLFEHNRSQEDLADIHNNMGYNALQQGDFEGATELHQKALDIAEQTNSPLLCADVNSSLAIIASIQADWDTAIDYFEASLDAYEEANHPKGMAHTYQNLAMAYVDCEEWETAGECYEAATELAEEHGDTALLTVIYINRAEFLLNLSNIGPAETYCNKALTLFRQMGDRIGIAEAQKLLGRVARRKQAWTEAIEHFQESVKLFESCENTQGLAEVYHEFGLMHVDQDNMDEAQECLNQSKTLFVQLGARDELVRVEESLALCA